MKKSNTLVMTVNYRGVENYSTDYLESIRKQNTNQFDLLILNDNTSSLNLKEININVKEITIFGKKSPSMIRFDGLCYAIKNDYHNLIFSDLDDYFSENRISLSIKELKNYDFVFNEINLIDKNNELIEENYLHKIKVEKYIESYKQIIDYNYLGLTNTGINLFALKNFYIPENVIAVDWWIFTVLLLDSATGKYTDNAVTNYRQSHENLVGMKKTLNIARLETGVKVKIAHYHNVIEYCKQNNYTKALNNYALKKEGMLELESVLQDKNFRDKYINLINNNLEKIYRGWWSEIITINEWKNYEN